MIAAEFVERLFDAMPSAEELEGYGLDESEIEEVQRTFTAQKRQQPVDTTGLHESALASLFRDFDCSAIEIGLVRFCSEMSRSALGWHFADCESEQVLLASDGSVLLADSGNAVKDFMRADSVRIP